MYNQKVDLRKGNELMLFLTSNGKPVAYATSCGYDQSADTIDTSNKMSGNWKDFIPGQNSYTISSESMLSMTSGQMSFAAMKAIADAQETVDFVIAERLEENGDYVAGNVVAKGKAMFTALSLKADNGAVCTASTTLQGKGESVGGVPFIVPSMPVISMEGTTTTPGTVVLSVNGYALTANIAAVVLGSDASLFALSQSSIVQSGGRASAQITITYSPDAVGTDAAVIKLTSTGADDVLIPITGVAAS
ncbi:MAG: phage tail protein [Bacteroides sp.]|jgi:hypothetical protein|nr:phage tail protein [Bacteroides sp.]